MQTPGVFKYNYAFLYQSIAVYAATLAVYLVARGSMHEQFSEVLYDPVVYLLCIIILISVLAVLYNVFMRRKIEVSSSKVILESAFRRTEISKSEVRSVKVSVERGRGGMTPVRVITIFTKSRRRPIRIRPYNFEHSEELFSALKSWAGEMIRSRSRRQRLRPPRTAL